MNLLLFHGGVHDSPVLIANLVELVNRRKAPIRERQYSRLQGEPSVTERVPDGSCGQTGPRDATARSQLATRGQFGHVVQDLRLGHSRITHQEDVYVTS